MFGGGVMVGWGVMMWILVTRLMPREPALARLILIEGTLAWFVVDCLGSFASGGYLNIPLNIALTPNYEVRPQPVPLGMPSNRIIVP